MKRTDLASPVGKQPMCPDGAADNLVDVFGRLILAVDFLILPVRELTCDKAHVAGQRAELVSWVGDGSGAAGLRGTIERAGEHVPSPLRWMANGYASRPK